MTPDMLIARFSEIDADGFIGVQVDNYGAKAEFGAVEAHHPFGFISRPRDPDLDGDGNVKLGCTVLRLAEGNESHVIVLGDPRYTALLPAATKKKGGSTQYAVTVDGAVSYAALDGDDGSYKLKIPSGIVEVDTVFKVGPGSTEPLAMGDALNNLLQAVRSLAQSLSGLTAPPLAPLVAIGTNLLTSLTPGPPGFYPDQTTTTKLEAI